MCAYLCAVVSGVCVCVCVPVVCAGCVCVCVCVIRVCNPCKPTQNRFPDPHFWKDRMCLCLKYVGGRLSQGAGWVTPPKAFICSLFVIFVLFFKVLSDFKKLR